VGRTAAEGEEVDWVEWGSEVGGVVVVDEGGGGVVVVVEVGVVLVVEGLVEVEDVLDGGTMTVELRTPWWGG
jgi:hypothetical protein